MSVVYNSFKRDIMNGGIDLDTDTIKCALVSASYTPDIDAHDNFDDITNEVSGTNWAAGGQILSVTITADTTNDRGKFTATNISVATVTLTGATQAIIYKSTGVPSSSKLVACIDLGATLSPVAGTLAINWHSNGILTLT